MYALVED